MKSTLKGLFLFFMAMMAAMPASAQIEVWNIGKLQAMVEKVEDNAAGKVFVSPVELTSEEQIAAVDGFYQTAPFKLDAPNAYSQETRMTWYYYAKPNPGYKFLGFVTTKTGTPTVDIATLKKVGDFYQTSGKTSATGARPETNPVPLARYAVFEKETSGGGEGGETGPLENIKATGALYPKTVVVGEGSDAMGVTDYVNLVGAKLTANGGETFGTGDQVTHVYILFDAELANIPEASAASRTLSQQVSLVNKTSGKRISFSQYNCVVWSKDKKALDLMISSEDRINNEDYQGVYEFKLPAGVVKSAKGAVNDAYEFTFTYGDPSKAKVEEPVNLNDYIGVWDQAKEQGEKIDNPCSFYLEKIGEEYYLTHLYGNAGIKVRIINNDNKFTLAATSADGYSFGTTRGGDVDASFMDNNGTKAIFIEQFQYVAPDKAAIIGGECGFQRSSTEVPTTPEVVLNILPILTPASGTYDDKVVVTCTFPEGCAGGKYWIDGAEIAAKLYTGPITLERSSRLSVAGINAQGRIITDVVTNEYIVNKVTEPYVTTDPEIGSSRESFYVTKLQWNNASSTALDLSAYKDGGSLRGQNPVWLVYEPTKKTVATQDYQGLWKDGTNGYKAYLYKNYRPTDEGAYTLHIAAGVFVVNGEKYDKEIVLKYFVGADEQTVPIFTPAAGTYKDKVQVSISYPKNAFYQFYQIEGKDRQNYTGPITITESCTIKAWGRTEDFSEEIETTTASYTIVPSEDKMDVLPKPMFSRSGNTITINETEPNTTIKYWFDNKMQTAQIYTGPFAVDKNCLISAVAYREHGISPTSDYTVSHFPKEETDFGTIEFRTPEDWESVNLTGMSPNGRFVCGYTDTGGTPMSFIWDLTSGKSEFISTQYYSRPSGISNDGTISGWRVDVDPVTGETISTSDETLFYGYCQNGEWTRQPSGMTVMGITSDNVLYGSYNGRPATYNIKTKTPMTYHGGKGCLNCVSADGKTFGGYVVVNGKTTPAYWVGNTDPVTISTDRECGVKSISGSGLWMYLDNAAWGSYYDIAGYRYNAADSKLETIVSMGAQYPSRYEWLYSIADDGTLYGVYDRSLLSHDAGSGLVYTTDGVWRNVTEVLEERGYVPDNAAILSSKFVSADQNIFVMTAFPADMDVIDAFHFGLAVKFDAQVKHSAPTTVKAVQMFGVKTVKVTWEAPMTGAEDIASYKIFKNGATLATVDAATLEYFDTDVENHTEYTYAVSAVYKDGVESELSFPYTIEVVLDAHKPARLLTYRQSGINDINLSWQAPVISMPKLQYFKEESETAAFGTAGYNSEWAVRITSADINVYKGMQIRTFQFLPTGPQAGYEIRFYKGLPGTTDYEDAPFYTQTINPATLVFGTVNTIALDTPQALPETEDLFVALYIRTKGNDNMLGVSHEGFRSGYSDLCKIEGVHEKFVSISKESTLTTEIVIPIGVGLGTDETLKASMVDQYEVSDNGVVLGNTENISYRTEDVAEGEHTFAVRTLYKDGEYSEPVSIKVNINKNEEAFVPVSNLAVETTADGKAEITWKAPLNDDKTNIHWGDMTPSKGLENKGYPVFAVASIYPVTMTNAYAGEYEITHLFYYPTADANFRLFFDNNNLGETYYDNYEIPEVNKLNVVPLETPVTVDQSTNYRLIIEVEDCPSGVAPLAFDSSNVCQDGYSNMVNAGNDWMTLYDVVQIGQHPNWLMGMVVRQKNAKEMPLQGYNVLIDGKMQNDKPLSECNFTTDALSEGSHKATVDVVYDATRTVASEPVSFVIGSTGIDGVAADMANAAKYDLQGRRVIADKNGRGLFIMNNKKYIKK